jgi:hypothetical protein
MNEENIRKRIRCLLDEIQNEADPVVLNRCRSIFKQEVSFSRRSYMAAYLLLLAEGSVEKKPVNVNSTRQGSGVTNENLRGSPLDSFREENRDRKKKGLFRKSYTDDSREAPPALSEEESIQLFISIGRNRKVFPREILTLTIAKAGISREDIGIIRILDNYSFIQVRKTVSDTVINALNGYKFRGRTLTVNYARNREDSAAETQEQ